MTNSRKVGNRFGYSKKEAKENLDGGNKLEELLNKLIEKGWCPFYDEDIQAIKIYSNMDMECLYGKRKSDFYYTSPRKITSKESGLWQFCVENDLIDYSNVRAYGIGFCPIEIQGAGNMQNYDNIHRLLWDCASLDESELEDFLLSNIKV